MYLRHLEYLRAVIEHGSFAAAARACGVSQPAISHGMHALQGRFGAPLLERQGRRRVPTDLARQVAATSRSVSERIDALAAGAAPKAGPAAARVLRCGVTPSAALVCGPALYAHWCEGRPRRSLEMVSADEGSLLAALLERRLDAVIAPLPRGFDPPGTLRHRLYALAPRIYARRDHPLARARSLAELEGAAWARVEPSTRGPVDVLSEAHRVRRLQPPRVAARCPDFASMLQMVAHTDLLAVVPHPALLGGQDRQLVPLRLRESLPLYEMWLFEPAGRSSALAAALREQLHVSGDDTATGASAA
ncbi:LysR family transcriptional regulator [Paracidovorax konjaci]|uniref:DNA-binding transcriptional regulator, LysR family n=1 Tax=Paracidovorax konjaci TaxID=32040 RepID=A0A1I1UWE8_9BURK|nr:LysR family transcriptional regulator [Paracidovorax konjaci]SFD75076.1 DNA-binding transcriptional regulator, LysR family [Paracidovorax konjaci]